MILGSAAAQRHGGVFAGVMGVHLQIIIFFLKHLIFSKNACIFHQKAVPLQRLNIFVQFIEHFVVSD